MFFKFTIIFLLGVVYAYAAPGIFDSVLGGGKKASDGAEGLFGMAKSIPFAGRFVDAGQALVEGGTETLKKGAETGLKAAETGYESGKRLFSG